MLADQQSSSRITTNMVNRPSGSFVNQLPNVPFSLKTASQIFYILRKRGLTFRNAQIPPRSGVVGDT